MVSNPTIRIFDLMVRRTLAEEDQHVFDALNHAARETQEQERRSDASDAIEEALRGTEGLPLVATQMANTMRDRFDNISSIDALRQYIARWSFHNENT